MTAEVWEQECRLLTPLPATLPEPFDVVVYRPFGIDCTVSFEGLRYSVPFRFVGQQVEVGSLTGRVLMLKDMAVNADHARGTEAFLVRDEAHCEGDNTDRVLAPVRAMARDGQRDHRGRYVARHLVNLDVALARKGRCRLTRGA